MPKPELEIAIFKIYRVDGLNLLRAREAAGLSQNELAEFMEGIDGWCQQGISQKECPNILHRVSEEAYQRLKVLFVLNAV